VHVIGSNQAISCSPGIDLARSVIRGDIARVVLVVFNEEFVTLLEALSKRKLFGVVELLFRSFAKRFKIFDALLFA
jgi:hypothetical protein